MNLLVNIFFSALLLVLITTMIDLYQGVTEPWWTNNARVAFLVISSLILGFIAPRRRTKK